ncbi:MAG: cellulase family glycosylhydrolase [Paludibacteraceae bacterium]|nr:cellulase family glycosylhydrolase [Paludibacteraceae bacterium]
MKKTIFSVFLFLSCLFSANAENNGFVAEYGRLKLVGNQLSSEKGEAVQLKGFNTGVITADDDACIDRSAFKNMKKWGCQSVRLNYSPSTHSNALLEKLKNYIDICAEFGMYAIVDWHVFKENTTPTGVPMDYVKDATDFFGTISAYAKEKGYIHVIYEICNEPEDLEWKYIKEYADIILPVIESNDPGAIVIVGTSDWSQRLTPVLNDPINADDYDLGIMYAFHYSACSHLQLLSEIIMTVDRLPIFVSDWSSSDYKYDPDKVCAQESEQLFKYMNGSKTKVSWNYWKWGDEDGIWKNCKDGFNVENLTETGSFIVEHEQFPVDPKWYENFRQTGRLKIVDNKLSTEDGDPIQLKGFNSGVITLDNEECLSKEALQTMKEWGCNSIRLNYSPSTHSMEMLERYKGYIDMCAEVGLYAILDWHVYDETASEYGDPTYYTYDAMEFFTRLSDYVKEKGYMFLIYDVCSDPSGVDWPHIKEYADTILSIIESKDPGAISIVSVPQWSQRIMDPVLEPIDPNRFDLGIMYAFHYAACDHKPLLANFKIASESIPVYVSDWSSSDFTCDPDKVCKEESDEFLDYVNRLKNISWNYWAWGGKTGIWKDCGAGLNKNNLTKTGSYILTETGLFDFKDDSPSDAQNIDNDGFVNVVPNPTDDAFNIIFKGKANVCIYDVIGQKVFEKDGVDAMYVNDDFATGIYCVVVKGEDYVGNVKLIVR